MSYILKTTYLNIKYIRAPVFSRARLCYFFSWAGWVSYIERICQPFLLGFGQLWHLLSNHENCCACCYMQMWNMKMWEHNFTYHDFKIYYTVSSSLLLKGSEMELQICPTICSMLIVFQYDFFLALRQCILTYLLKIGHLQWSVIYKRITSITFIDKQLNHYILQSLCSPDVWYTDITFFSCCFLLWIHNPATCLQ